MEETYIDSRISTMPDAKRILEPPELSPTERWKTEDYDLKGKYPGKFIVFNHHSYNSNLELSNRDGTIVDAERVKETFENMGFKEAEKCQEDLTCNQIMGKINEVTLEPFDDYGSIVIVILTHGELGKLYAKDKEYEVTMLWNVLTQDKNAKNLAGKPKLFLIQACQGEEGDSGVCYTDAKPAEIVEEQKIFRIPLFADFLVAFSSSPGYVSFRQKDGSWFIQCLCDAIDHFKDIMDFESMLTLVKYDVARNKQSNSPYKPEYHAKKQIPVVSSTLTKKLYLTKAAASKEKLPIQITIRHPDVIKYRDRNDESEESDVDNKPIKKEQIRKRSTTKNVPEPRILKHTDRATSVDLRSTGANDNILGYALISLVTFLVTCFIFWMLRSDYNIYCHPPM